VAPVNVFERRSKKKKKKKKKKVEKNAGKYKWIRFNYHICEYSRIRLSIYLTCWVIHLAEKQPIYCFLSKGIITG
jgi:hypothetical protein